MKQRYCNHCESPLIREDEARAAREAADAGDGVFNAVCPICGLHLPHCHFGKLLGTPMQAVTAREANRRELAEN